MATKPSSRPTKDVLEELRKLLNPDDIQHTGAKAGSALLLGLEDKALYEVFSRVCLRRRSSPASVIRQVLPDEIGGQNEENLVAAMRRLSLVGTQLVSKIQRAEEEKAAKARPAGLKPLPNRTQTLEANPGLPLDAHIKAAKSAKKDLDCMTKMAGLAALLENQLESLYTYPARQAQPFMGVRHVNMVAQTYMNTLEKLHRMQMDVGIVEKMPEKMEVNMRQAGAFQTYVGELSQDHKQSMIEFADAFCKFAVERSKGDANNR